MMDVRQLLEPLVDAAGAPPSYEGLERRVGARRRRRHTVTAILTVLVIAIAIPAVLWATSSNPSTVQTPARQSPPPPGPDPSDPESVRDALGQGEEVMTVYGKRAGYKCGSPLVLPAGVKATPVCAPYGGGNVVGYMTFGDVGFVDKSTGRDRTALGLLVRCYADVKEYSLSGTVPFTNQCRSALKAQGVQVRRIKRGSPEAVARLNAYMECTRQALSTGVDVNEACPSPQP